MSSYFKKLPNFEYVSRLPNSKIGDYIQVKNIFKRGNIRPDIFENISFFEKYKIIGNERPDNVSFKIYEDAKYDWVILLSNNIINIQTEWPLTQDEFDNYLRDKYGNGLTTEEEVYNIIYNGIHHYETIEIKNSRGVTIIPAGLEVPEDYMKDSTYYDDLTETLELISSATVPVTNYEYEEKIEDGKRNIYVLKPRYLNIIVDDLDNMMRYKEGASQNLSDTLKRADNIKLYN